jgi:hypothetical protein
MKMKNLAFMQAIATEPTDRTMIHGPWTEGKCTAVSNSVSVLQTEVEPISETESFL